MYQVEVFSFILREFSVITVAINLVTRMANLFDSNGRSVGSSNVSINGNVVTISFENAD